jgi:hypothetical protein
MFKVLLISIVAVPVVFGMKAAACRSRRRGLLLLLTLVLTYEVFYLVLLYYLRVRWVAWA